MSTEKDNFIRLLQNNNPTEMMEYLLSNGKGPKPFNPFRLLSKEELEEYRNGTNNERADG